MLLAALVAARARRSFPRPLATAVRRIVLKVALGGVRVMALCDAGVHE
jgi:hypothetical protein